MNTWKTVATLSVACLGGAVPSVTSAEAELEWSDQLAVFAPLDRSHPVVDDADLASIPEKLEIGAAEEFPAVTLEPVHVDWVAGEPIDLESYIGASPEDAGYVFAEIDSPVEQTVTLGIGADWWVQCWMNGEPFFDTLGSGNRSGRFSILDHRPEVKLREGRNILAMRFLRGRASALLAVGDESMFRAERRRQAERYGLNELPEDFSDRLLFPEREQAIISSTWVRDFSLPDADLSEGALVGLQAMPERQMVLDTSTARAAILDTLNRRFEDEPVRIRLAKDRYPFEDGHLDAIVWTTPPDPDSDPAGGLEVRLKDAAGEVLARHHIDELSRSGLFFSVGFPPGLEGSNGALEVVWRDGDTEMGRASAPFRVEPASGVETSGRIPVRVINQPGAVIDGLPLTTGVPFPHGALEDEANVRLVDEHGEEVPLQTRLTARWSRFGPIKWLLCDFTADLDGAPREFFLEYGPDIERGLFEEITVAEGETGFPAVEAGRVRVTETGAVEFDPAGDGNFKKVLSSEALRGAFVEHENGSVFTMSEGAVHSIEEIGSEKIMVRRSGWYRDEESGEEFCNYVTRLVFHRDSPVIRIFHTWIFTGDGNADRIANMGWRFPVAGDFESDGILSAFQDGVWHDATNLVQFDYQQYDLLDGASRERLDGRTPGVMSGVVDGTRVTFGVKDFWESFPSEVEVTDSGLVFYNWPRNNPPAFFESPVALQDAFRNRFVHEGEVLDFRLPEEYVEGPIRDEVREPHWGEGRSETANAQGIARTEEMFLYLADDRVGADEAATVVRGLNDETLRAVVDPVWLTSSGVFDEGGVAVHPVDKENFPDIERIYDLTMEGPRRWVEHLGVYGMWLHGDYPTWNINLGGRTVSAYRTFRGNHHAFPLRWIPYIRSGDPRFFKLAENATRRLADANFCHYATEDIDRKVGPDYFRRQGRWDRSLIPWTGRLGPHLRSYTVDTDYLWDTYYLTGYGRARDVAILFGELTQHDHVRISPGTARTTRGMQSMMTSYLDMYQATYDPWFIAAAHEFADLYLHLCGDLEELDPLVFSSGMAGNFWRAGCPRFFAFTGRENYQQHARNNVIAHASPHVATQAAGYSGGGGASLRASAHAWDLTGDPFYLHRLAAGLESVRINGYEGDIEYRWGLPTGSHGGSASGNALPIPMAMSILAGLDEDLDPIHNPAAISGTFLGDEPSAQQRISGDELSGEYHFRYPDLYVRLDEAGPLDLIFDVMRRRGRDGYDYFDYQPFKYEIHGPNETYFSEEGDAPENVQITGPEGIYLINRFTRIPADANNLMRRLSRAYGVTALPVAGPDIPEVIKFSSDETGTSVRVGSQGYWFYVPEDLESFWIDFTETPGGRQAVNRVSVWNADGERVWDKSYSRGDTPEKVTIEVPSDQRGQLWKATGGDFRLDPHIPEYFSLRRSKWFNPEETD